MIKVTDLAGNGKLINCDLIEKVEASPDTVILLVNGHSFMVKDSPDEILEKVIQFKRLCNEHSQGAQL